MTYDQAILIGHTQTLHHLRIRSDVRGAVIDTVNRTAKHAVQIALNQVRNTDQGGRTGVNSAIEKAVAGWVRVALSDDVRSAKEQIVHKVPLLSMRKLQQNKCPKICIRPEEVQAA